MSKYLVSRRSEEMVVRAWLALSWNLLDLSNGIMIRILLFIL